MAFTTINETFPISRRLKFIESETIIRFGKEINGFSNFNNLSEKNDNEDISKFLDIRSSRKKILFSGGYGIYNYFFTSIPSLLGLAKEFPDFIFIFDYSMVHLERTAKTFVPFTKKILESLGIECYFITSNLLPGVIVNNFIQINNGEVNTKKEDIVDATTLYRALAKNKSDQKPFRKVYLTRKNITPRNYDCIKEGLSTNIDYRMYEEHVLEEYFRGLGVEVVCPEDFKTMEDQINFFNEVSLIISVTSSGLTNSVFMQDGTTMLELVTSFPQQYEIEDREECEGTETLHHIYHAVAYLTNKQYMSIPNYTRQARDIIDIIEGSELLQGVLRG
jgi:hypothetical protein